jgi:uncharacterized protein YoxC
MVYAGIALLVIAVAFCILVLVLIPTILEAKKTIVTVGTLAETVQQELQPTLKELTAVLAELKTVGGGVAEHTDDVRCFMSALGETGNNIHVINRSVGTVVTTLNTASAWLTGAKVAGKYLVQGYLNKRGK